MIAVLNTYGLYETSNIYRNLIANRSLMYEADKCYFFESEDLLVLDEQQNVKKSKQVQKCSIKFTDNNPIYIQKKVPYILIDKAILFHFRHHFVNFFSVPSLIQGPSDKT